MLASPTLAWNLATPDHLAQVPATLVRPPASLSSQLLSKPSLEGQQYLSAI